MVGSRFFRFYAFGHQSPPFAWFLHGFPPCEFYEGIDEVEGKNGKVVEQFTHNSLFRVQNYTFSSSSPKKSA